MDVGADLEPKRPSSVYYAEETHRAEGLKWPVPLGGPFAFYTTWNALAAIIATIVVVLTLPWMRVWSSTRKVAAFTIVPIAIAMIASIVCTTIISQMLLAFNAKIERSDEEPDLHKHKKLALSVNFVQKMLTYNFIYHLGPLIFAVVLGVAIAFIPGPSTMLGRGAVFLTSLALFVALTMAWVLTKVDLKNTEKGAPVSAIGWDKIEYVYRNPPKWYFTAMFPCVGLLTLIVATFALYGASTPMGFKGF
jgi:hypothetical protein